MKILVANLGSTSFKYRLFDMAGQRAACRGGIERIGSPESRCMVEIGGRRQEQTLRVPDHAEAVRQCLAQLTDPRVRLPRARPSEVSAIAFKAVHGGRDQRRAAGHARRAGRHGGDERRGPGPQSALHRGHAAVEPRSCRRFRWWRPSRPTSTHDSRRATATTPFPTSGPKTAWCAAGASTGPATATSPGGRPNCSAAGPADHLLPPGRLQFAVRHSQRPERGHQHGHERRRAACRRTTAWAISTPSPCR